MLLLATLAHLGVAAAAVGVIGGLPGLYLALMVAAQQNHRRVIPVTLPATARTGPLSDARYRTTPGKPEHHS